jgi:hypothetical protein
MKRIERVFLAVPLAVGILAGWLVKMARLTKATLAEGYQIGSKP